MSFEEFGAFLEEPEDNPSLPKIMVVDDDSFIRESLKALLRNRYRVSAFGEGASAVDAIDESFDAVLVDIMMVPHNGFWVYDQIHQKLPELPIIFNSGYQQTAVDADIKGRYRPFAYLTKGAAVSELLRTISSAVKCRRDLRGL